PIPATALVPLIAFPVFGEGFSVDDVGAEYGNNIIFLFMRGFLIAIAMQRWDLHRRIALLAVRAMGARPTRVVARLVIATAFLSLRVSNPPAAVVMLPIGVSVLMLAAELGGGRAGEDGDAGDGAGDDDENVMPAIDASADPGSDEVKDAVIRS